MKSNISLKNIFFGVVAVCSLNACTDNFEEINTNQNGPVDVDPALLLPGIQETTADRLYDTFLGGDMGATWVQQWAKLQYNEEERYQPRVTILNNTWNGFYAGPLRETEVMYDEAKENGNQVLMGVALVWRSYVYSILTDLYGDIPYTEALRADEGITAPVYDEQSVIYPALIDSLEAAVGYLSSGEGALPGGRDLVYAGDLEKWVKFANSLRVRLIMRSSAKIGADYTGDLQSIVDSGLLFESNADNAQLQYTGTNPNANPVWNTVVYTNRLEWRVSETLVDYMISVDDPRLAVFAQPNDAGEFRGVGPGYEDPTAEGYDFANTSMLGWYFLQPDAPATFMDYAELNFLLAEAAVKGYISGGTTTARDYYYAGIRASFNMYDGVTVTDPFDDEGEESYNLDEDVFEDYIDNTGVQFNSPNALEQIGIQKWISLFGQGIEAWTEWRRTGFPELSPVANPIGITEIPSRFLYPSDEQSLNTVNYNAAVQAIGGNSLTAPVWWME